jgi:RNA polymerase sigma-70 factor (ECF subfamily)
MDRSAFETEAMAWADTVYRVARWMVSDPSLADDLVQETYLRAFKGFATFQPGTDCRSWLLRILRNTATDYRRKKRLATVEYDEADPGELTARAAKAENEAFGSPEKWQALLESSLDDDLYAAVNTLAEPLRQAFCLVVLGECSYKEAAEMLGCKEGTIKSRMSRACEQLRNALTEKGTTTFRLEPTTAGAAHV